MGFVAKQNSDFWFFWDTLLDNAEDLRKVLKKQNILDILEAKKKHGRGRQVMTDVQVLL